MEIRRVSSSGNGHAFGFGTEVPEYDAAIEQVDRQVGRLVAGLDRRAHRLEESRCPAEDWLVVATTDHGGSARARMPREMWRGFAEGCGCVHKGIPQTDLRGVHGLRDLPQHYQTFQIFARSRSLDLGEMLPAPKPEDVVPALLQHLLPQGAATQGFLGKARCFAATVPAIPSDMAEPPPKRGRKE